MPRRHSEYHLTVAADPWTRIRTLRRSGALAPARRLDNSLGSGGAEDSYLFWQSDMTGAYQVGAELSEWERESGRDVVSVLQELGRSPTDQALGIPDQEIQLDSGSRVGEALEIADEPPLREIRELQVGKSLHARGHRITYIRKNRDGTIHVVVVE